MGAWEKIEKVMNWLGEPAIEFTYLRIKNPELLTIEQAKEVKRLITKKKMVVIDHEES